MIRSFQPKQTAEYLEWPPLEASGKGYSELFATVCRHVWTVCTFLYQLSIGVFMIKFQKITYKSASKDDGWEKVEQICKLSIREQKLDGLCIVMMVLLWKFWPKILFLMVVKIMTKILLGSDFWDTL